MVTPYSEKSKSAAACAVDAVGLAAQGAGNIIGQAANRGLRAVGINIPRGLPAANPLKSVSTAIRESKTPGGKTALEISKPSGDISKPESWSLGDALTIGRYARHAADVIGPFAMPACAGAMSKVGKLGAAAQTGSRAPYLVGLAALVTHACLAPVETIAAIALVGSLNLASNAADSWLRKRSR